MIRLCTHDQTSVCETRVVIAMRTSCGYAVDDAQRAWGTQDLWTDARCPVRSLSCAGTSSLAAEMCAPHCWCHLATQSTRARSCRHYAASLIRPHQAVWGRSALHGPVDALVSDFLRAACWQRPCPFLQTANDLHSIGSKKRVMRCCTRVQDGPAGLAASALLAHLLERRGVGSSVLLILIHEVGNDDSCQQACSTTLAQGVQGAHPTSVRAQPVLMRASDPAVSPSDCSDEYCCSDVLSPVP